MGLANCTANCYGMLIIADLNWQSNVNITVLYGGPHRGMLGKIVQYIKKERYKNSYNLCIDCDVKFHVLLMLCNVAHIA